MFGLHDFCVKDPDVMHMEKVLKSKFSIIISSVSSPHSAFQHLIRPLHGITVADLAGKSVLACITQQQWPTFLRLAHEAQEREPFTTITVVTPNTGPTGHMFEGWPILRQGLNPWLW
mgnify:FL=1